MKHLIFLCVLLCPGAANSADIFWSPTSFEDGTPAIIYLTDESDKACPAMWYRAHAVNKKTGATNRDRLCWTSGISGGEILANRTTGATQALSPVGIVKSSQEGNPSLLNKFMRKHVSELIHRQQQINEVVHEEMRPPRTPEQIKQDEKYAADQAELSRQTEDRQEKENAAYEAKRELERRRLGDESVRDEPQPPALLRFLRGY